MLAMFVTATMVAVAVFVIRESVRGRRW